MIVAGIDIGSNATRLTISRAPKKGRYHEPKDMIGKFRFPCRLGDDVFKAGSIGHEKAQEMQSVFAQIKDLLQEHKVEKIKGVATSAFRDASNGTALLKELSEKYDIPCDVISGEQEAKLMSQGLERRKTFTFDAAHLHIDIGGGSFELSCYHKGSFLFQESLDLGTLRLIEDTNNGKLVEDYLNKLKMIDDVFEGFDAKSFGKFKLHGTGGNFKRLGALRKFSFDKEREDVLKRKDIKAMIELYSKHPGRELSEHTPIKEENAALIIPSLLLIERILDFWPAKKINISKLSLSHVLLDELCASY